jgi:tRNA (cytidine/uridine-2'-O-)-methyltransferase
MWKKTQKACFSSFKTASHSATSGRPSYQKNQTFSRASGKTFVLSMNIVLYQPQIPQNTGNIVRTCAVTGCGLILVRPLGFRTSDRMLRRAGLDYWEGVNVTFIDNLNDYLRETSAPFYFFSSKAKKIYSDATFSKESIFIFGSETSGLPQEFWEKWPENFFTIPMKQDSRCLNLSNAVSIIIYEAWRQRGFST